MKEKTILIFVSICLVLSFSACQKEPVLSLTGLTNIELDASGGNQTISFQTNRNWTVSWSEPWITVSPSSGSASNGPITLNVRADANQGVARSATVTIRAEGLSQTINVKQESGDLLVGTWGLIFYEYRHWHNGQLSGNEDINCNPYAPTSYYDMKYVFNHIGNDTYRVTNYGWDPNGQKWIAGETAQMPRHNNMLITTVPNSDGSYRTAEIEIRSLTPERLVLYGLERNVPEPGDEYYIKVTFTRMNQ